MPSDLAKKYNLKSPAVKRLMREAAELCNPTDQYYAQPLEDNLFEWHFTVRGPPDTEFEDGRYHGRIILPPEYPMKPPSIILITPNGRFEIGKKICLSMSAHHPETWQPSWSIRTVLLAIIGFMPTPGGGAIGALDYTAEERKILAKKSKDWKCEVCGCESSTVILERDRSKEKQETQEANEVAAQISFKTEEKSKANSQSASQPHSPSTPQNLQAQQQQQQQLQQQQFFNNAFPQCYGMYNNTAPGQYMNNHHAIQHQQPSHSRTVDSPNSPEVCNAAMQESTTRESPSSPQTTSAPSDSTDGLRQRVTSGGAANDVTDGNPSESSSSHPRLQENVQGQSRTEQVTLLLTWIVTVALVILVLRRLVLDGTALSQ